MNSNRAAGEEFDHYIKKPKLDTLFNSKRFRPDPSFSGYERFAFAAERAIPWDLVEYAQRGLKEFVKMNISPEAMIGDRPFKEIVEEDEKLEDIISTPEAFDVIRGRFEQKRSELGTWDLRKIVEYDISDRESPLLR